MRNSDAPMREQRRQTYAYNDIMVTIHSSGIRGKRTVRNVYASRRRHEEAKNLFLSWFFP